jgi:hypothetical protein
MLALLVPSGTSAAVHLDSIGTFDAPVHVTSLPGEPDRLLVVEQGGTIQLVDHGVASTFLDLTNPRIVSAGGERGLLSVAPAPDYASSHHLYVFFTRTGDGALEVDEFTASGASVPLSSRRPLLAISHPNYSNHNGGQLQFGPDGMLYIGTGDGGSSGDPTGNAQNLGSLLGKILRIDPHPSGSSPFTVPDGNPFPGSPIWAYGLRNPWRFTFDRMNGALLIGDVGQNEFEEVDYRAQPDAGRGVNFGWDCREAFSPYSEPAPSCDGTTGFVNPIYADNRQNGGCAIVGGYVVRDASLGDLYGRYIFSDSCDGTIRSFSPSAPPEIGKARSVGLEASSPSSFGEDACGRLYVASLGDGDVSRFEGDTPAQCPSSGGGGGRNGLRCAGEPATRTVAAGGSVKGSPGDDVIVADKRNNKIRSGGGDDLICALGGRDRIRAGAGRDSVRGGAGKDRIEGGPGKDRCRGGGGKDQKESC